MSSRSIPPGFHPVRRDRLLQGELEFHYNPEEARLRVHWRR